MRGATEIAGPAVSTHRSGFALTPAVIGALLVLAASFALSVGFIVANGGMALSVAPSGDVKTAVESTAANVEPSIAPTAAPPASSLAVTASSAPSAQPSIAPTPEPSDAATVAPTIASTPLPSSDRYALLEPCPDAPDCWIYVIRGGDNLVSIARYFGIPLATVTELNPWTESTQLVAGQKLRLPAPAR